MKTEKAQKQDWEFVWYHGNKIKHHSYITISVASLYFAFTVAICSLKSTH